MKKALLLLTLLTLSFVGCKKDELKPEPSADFTFGRENVSNYVSRDSFWGVPTNESTNAVSCLWDFGDGRTSNEKAPEISYKKAGTYILSMTATNADGKTATTRKTVTILKPFIKNFIIENLSGWKGFDFHTLKQFNGGDVWVEVYKPVKGVAYKMQPNSLYDYPLYYKSDVIKNVPASSTGFINIDVNEQISLAGIIERETEYVFTVFVRDQAGTHVLISSDLQAIASNTLPTGYDLLTYKWKKGYAGSSAALVFTYR